MITKQILDKPDKEIIEFKSKPGLNKKLVKEISKLKNEPKWILNKRLKSLEWFYKLPMPKWGPSLKKLDFSEIHYFIKHFSKKATSWEDIPEEIKDRFEKLGIPEAERKFLAGAGAQYDSEVIYHKLKRAYEKKGVIFLDFDEAVKEYPKLIKKYFMTTCIPVNLHKFAALHGAVWSGGTFIYVPKNTKLKMPLQAYFRMNTRGAGQFEHTLIIADENSEVHYIEGCSAPRYSKASLHAGCVEIHVLKNAKVRYSSIENWSKNTFNLNTKRAIVHENASIHWINGNLGSNVTMLYPCSVLLGNNSTSYYTGIAFAGKNQNQDTGSKTIHIGKNTSSLINSKSICKDNGITTYRGLISIKETAKNAKTKIVCNSLILDNKSSSNTYPIIQTKNPTATIAHEAYVGKISQEQIFYLTSRGLTEEEATKLIISGFIDPLIKKLPIEYALELNRLIELEIENSPT
jgi:Fe-S cluster assembly protein SufB